MPKVTLEVDAKDLKDRTTDARGRVRLGPEYAGRDVVVAVVEDEDGE